MIKLEKQINDNFDIKSQIDKNQQLIKNKTNDLDNKNDIISYLQNELNNLKVICNKAND